MIFWILGCPDHNELKNILKDNEDLKGKFILKLDDIMKNGYPDSDFLP